jgi:hypothetical protein
MSFILGFSSCLLLVMCGALIFIKWLEQKRKVVTIIDCVVSKPRGIGGDEDGGASVAPLSETECRIRVSRLIGESQWAVIEQRMRLRVDTGSVRKYDGAESGGLVSDHAISSFCGSSDTYRVTCGNFSLADPLYRRGDRGADGKLYETPVPMPLVKENRELLHKMGFHISDNGLFAIFGDTDDDEKKKEEEEKKEV